MFYPPILKTKLWVAYNPYNENYSRLKCAIWIRPTCSNISDAVQN